MGESFSGLLKTRPVAKTRRLRLHVLQGQACVDALGLGSDGLGLDGLGPSSLGATILGTTIAQQRFGVLVPKRLVRRAVDRNALKRLCRTVCRQALADRQTRLINNLATGHKPEACAVLVCVTQTTTAVPPSEHVAWLTELHQLFAKIP